MLIMRSLITGVSGQAGSYLAEHLLRRGYEVYGMVRRNTSFIPEQSFLARCLNDPKFHIVKGDVTDPYSMERLFEEIYPQHCYNAAAQSDVAESWRYPIHTVDATAKGPLHILEVIRKKVPSCKFVQFSSSELFGMAKECPQNENTPFYPRSPYGVSKLFAHWMTINYRESYDLFACNAILFNMESPRRGPNFVTQKIAQGVARIKKQLDNGEKVTPIKLGNLNAKRDWNDARESICMVVKMLEQSKPSDYVIGSGVAHDVGEFVHDSLIAAGIPCWHEGSGERKEWGNFHLLHGDDLIVVSDQEFIRPAEVPLLVADSRKAQTELGYKPSCSIFDNLVREMVQSAMKSSHELLRQ